MQIVLPQRKKIRTDIIYFLNDVTVIWKYSCTNHYALRLVSGEIHEADHFEEQQHQEHVHHWMNPPAHLHEGQSKSLCYLLKGTYSSRLKDIYDVCRTQPSAIEVRWLRDM